VNDNDLLTPREATEYLAQFGMSRSPTTLAKLRVFGNGPVYLKIGHAVRYRPAHLRAFVAVSTTEMASTSAPVSVDQSADDQVSA